MKGNLKSDMLIYNKFYYPAIYQRTKNIEIFYLPEYSPHLNLIEILWRFMKYERIESGAYKSWKTLVAYVEDVIINFGKKYRINFV